ncbi:hypothetical protein AZI86_16260 [Bdellovibrio bacteriovorus]|uniref:DUF1398 domain-containing protein n=1 Tax=Bdellovibrio bacteriovorus TaxID=959 RepID=A0A150WH83_BDEBC|nr:DUF1398 family protein [Bdellovibrio bacteriovorus]KYG62388.1 hypothetical protein AZI86_16260 [Bdellovibrio bacteriovorus]
MTSPQEAIQNAYQRAMEIKPKVGGYPYLAECLRQAGVQKYTYNLPSCQSIYITDKGNVVSQGELLVKGMADVPAFDKNAFINILRISQNGDSTFPEFIKSTWESGVVSYVADLINRKVTYYGALGESYVEDFPAVKIS